MVLITANLTSRLATWEIQWPKTQSREKRERNQTVEFDSNKIGPLQQPYKSWVYPRDAAVLKTKHSMRLGLPYWGDPPSTACPNSRKRSPKAAPPGRITVSPAAHLEAVQLGTYRQKTISQPRPVRQIKASRRY